MVFLLKIKEFKFFLKWVFNGNITTTFIFYVKKILRKATRKRYYSYPEAVNECIKSNEINNISFSAHSYTRNSKNFSKIDWLREYKDPEDFERMHRWNWIMLELSSNNKISVDEIIFQQEGWVDLFQTKKLPNKKLNKLIWESYTVGERISNTVVFYHLTLGFVPSERVFYAIIQQTRYLINNLEYFGKNTGNHVVNNARAIYLAGVSFDCSEWIKLAFIIIKRELPILITEDGFLREGSSHYQFLFTRWLLEIYYFASIANDNKMRDFLSLYLKKLIKQCNFFLIYDEFKHMWKIPLFGDISPDFQPEWLLDLPWSNLAPTSSFLSDQYKVTNNSWSSLWVNKCVSRVKGNFCSDGYKTDVISNNPESGWFRGGVGNAMIFMRVDKKLIPGYVGHHHHDMYHFCLYYKGQAILVDSGRMDYKYKGLWSEFGVSPYAHNSILIDGIGAVPNKSNNYPIEYTQANNRVNFLKKENLITYTLSSSCFKRIDPNISVLRSITLGNGKCLVKDVFYGTGKHLIESFFHWGVGVGVAHISKNVWSINFGTHAGYFKIVQDYNLKHSFYDGGDEPFGWVVDKYGEKKSSSTLQFKGLVYFPVTIEYELTWSM